MPWACLEETCLKELQSLGKVYNKVAGSELLWKVPVVCQLTLASSVCTLPQNSRSSYLALFIHSSISKHLSTVAVLP